MSEEMEKRREEENRLRRKLAEGRRRHIEQGLLQQEHPVRDEQNRRWVKCELCGRVAMTKEFVSYGGPHHVNLGICKECNKNNPEVDRIRTSRRQTLSLPKKVPIEPGEHLLVCKECGRNLIERNGRYGKFWGCSNYPKCRYTEKYKK